jgi:hypothetical protein
MSKLRKLAIVALLALGSARSVDGAWALDRAWALNFAAASSTTVTFAYGGAVASGALLVCFVQASNQINGVPTGVTDSTNGGAWTQFNQGSPVSPTPLNYAWTGWYYLNSAAGTPTVTVTFTGASTNRGITCGSYTGIATASAFDVGSGQGQTNPGTGTDAVHTGDTAATAGANELAVAAAITQVSTTLTEGTGWTSRLNSTFTGVHTVLVEDRNVAASSTVRGTWTTNGAGADPQSLVGVFKEPAAAGGCTGGFLLLGVGKCE